jgi:hypothetical protein
VEVVAHGRRVDPDNIRYDYLAAALAMVHHIRIVGPRDARVLRVILPAGFEEALAAYVAATGREGAVYRTYAAEYVAVVAEELALPFKKQVRRDAWERFQSEVAVLPERELLAMLEEAKGLSGKYRDVDTGEALTGHLAAWDW